MISVAIIDIIGLTYDGNTLADRGLGGSESAVILMSKELAKLGANVTVFNNCIDSKSKEGVFDGVTYIDHSKLDDFDDYTFDVVISSRTVIPFVPNNFYPPFAEYRPERYAKIKQNAKLKAIWMHDTFCRGDELLEDLLVHGHVDEIFTLSDFHTAYVTNCNHGRRRNFEVLKNKVFITRNGIVKYIDDVDISAKDPFQYVYNASVTKGMLPLVKEIWPEIKKNVPQAKLKVIGGYYRFRENAAPDAQEQDWRQLVADPYYKSLDIEFTGVIKQSEIAEILSKSSYMLFPGAFPETFGISTLESLAYNTPLVTTRFGALEETAVAQACYLIDYAIEPNSLFTDINKNNQVSRFIQLTLWATQNRYFHQQKMYSCNIVKDICTWDTVALQWKQHFYKKLGLFLDVNEYRKVSKINHRVHEVFGRRYTNKEELYIPRNKQQKITIITPTYNAENYIERCIKSVISQDYDNYHMYIIDDCSTDNTYAIAKKYEGEKVTVIKNNINKGAPRNHIETMRSKCSLDDIVMLLDGDDWLVNDNQIFHFYNNLYDGTTEFSYGSCWSVIDNIPLVAQHYPESVKQNRSYKSHRFNWNMPYTHLRTFKRYLLEKVNDNVFKDENGEWFKAGGDGSVFYALIEQAEPDKVKAVTDIVYNYNDANPLNDYKINGEEQTRNANKILGTNKGKTESMKTILIAIPTNKNIEAQTFKSIYDLEVPPGYKTYFQFFYGYQVDQVRNLIASWAERYDYLFSVDSDIAFPSDTLKKMLAHDKDMVSGLYIQRKPGEHILELYRNGYNINYNDISGMGLVEVDGCGFGCVLVKSEVIRKIGYPQFVYKSALDHNHTFSEDNYFCMKAKENGFRIWADTNILCDHIGSWTFKVNLPKTGVDRLRELGRQRLLPTTHVNYLKQIDFTPKVVYDIGACVLHWTNEAKDIWKDAKFIAFEAMSESKTIFEENNIDHYVGVLTNQDNKIIEFYQNTQHPGGNSYYKENEKINAQAPQYFNESHKRVMQGMTLDTVVKENKFPLPDLIKIDVQGAELDVLQGASETLKQCKHLILELQKVEYNKGAPLRDEVIAYVNTLGFKMISGPFCDNGPDGDYHFARD